MFHNIVTELISFPPWALLGCIASSPFILSFIFWENQSEVFLHFYFFVFDSVFYFFSTSLSFREKSSFLPQSFTSIKAPFLSLAYIFVSWSGFFSLIMSFYMDFNLSSMIFLISKLPQNSIHCWFHVFTWYASMCNCQLLQIIRRVVFNDSRIGLQLLP